MPSIYKMDFFTWINQLHPRLQHLLQERFSKAFTHYDLALAADAVQNSRMMCSIGEPEHLFPGTSPCSAEVTACHFLKNNDEEALKAMVDFWYRSSRHHELLQTRNILGIGFYYQPPPADILWATVRLR